MNNDPKPDTQNTEEPAIAAKPTVADPDAAGAAKPKELDRKTPAEPSLDRLDKERAADEGMVPPSVPKP